MDVHETVNIRKFLSGDRDDLRRISWQTAFHELKPGAVFSGSEILADAFTSYYTDYEPDSCFVAVADNRVVGYIIGTKNVPRMERISSKKIFPRLIWKALCSGVFLNRINLRFLFYCLRSACLGEFSAPKFCEKFPGMLHINIESGYRASGVGERLIKTFEAYLKDQQVSGVHFGTFTEGGKNFFIKMGFTILYQGKRSYLKPYLGKEIDFYIFGKKF
jgi:GNAT superfamily N-acetyltransferase